ncbi:beta-lactamase/transpeptidase-like protein, partial [Calocera cornea HHB12733]
MRGEPFDGDGYILFMSVTKGLTATVIHLLIERGFLDLDAPVCKYWPEFAKNGKENITVKMVLNHTSGLAAFPIEDNIHFSDFADLDKIIRCLEDMVPFWVPGTQLLYSVWTFGFMVGEIVRRVTGKTIGAVFREEISVPLGLDLWIGGLPEEKESRVIPWMPKTLPKLPES